jgi:hypothetical protein
MRSGHRDIARHREIGDSKELITTEMRRRGEKSDWVIGEKTDPVIQKVSNLDALTLCHPEQAQVEFHETSASRRTQVLPASGNAASGSSPRALEPIRQRFKSALHVLRSALREIFDESAYERFLQRTKTLHSAESYRAFMCERESAAAQKPRCC